MRAGERTFVDTNVLLYALDAADPAKQKRARDWLAVLWETGSGRLSCTLLER